MGKVKVGVIGVGSISEMHFAGRLGNPGGWFSDVEHSGGGPLIDLGICRFTSRARREPKLFSLHAAVQSYHECE